MSLAVWLGLAMYIYTVTTTSQIQFKRASADSCKRNKTVDEYKEYFYHLGSMQTLHIPIFASGYNQMPLQEWKHVVSRIGRRLGIRNGDYLWESGIGAGVFLEALSSGFSNVTLGGADTSSILHLARGRFKLQHTAIYISDIRNLNTVPRRLFKMFDKAVAFGVFQYLPSTEVFYGHSTSIWNLTILPCYISVFHTYSSSSEYTHIRAHVRTNMHTHMHTHTPKHTCIHANKHTSALALRHARKHRHPYTHAHTHTNTHTHTHTHKGACAREHTTLFLLHSSWYAHVHTLTHVHTGADLIALSHIQNALYTATMWQTH